MQIPVLIECLDGNGYRARGGEPFALAAEGRTPQEALSNLRGLIQGKVNQGEIVSLEVPARDHPWLKMAGMWEENDPLVREWVEIMAENRRRVDEEPDVR
jgi:predicted RNase H-like HicB family nuclease